MLTALGAALFLQNYVTDISTIGVYELTYEVRKTGKIDTIYINRFIEVIDIFK